jgi:hypothetical protein
MYVLHSIPYNLTADLVRGLPAYCKYLYAPGLVLVAYGLARISWTCLEGPFVALKRRVPYSDPAQRARFEGAKNASTGCMTAGALLD